MALARARKAVGPARCDEDRQLLELRPLAVWQALRRQGPAFWALNFYLFIEYVRPQSVWPVIDFLPWGQVALGVAVATTLLEPPLRRGFRLLDGLLVLFSCVLVASLATAFDAAYGFRNFGTYANWVILYYLMTRVVTTEVRLFLCVGAFFLWSFKMSQFGARAFVFGGFQFQSWGTTGGPGWFHNSGEFAIQMCIFLGMALHLLVGLRPYWSKWKQIVLFALLPGTAFLGVVMSSSRGGQIAAACVLLFAIAQSRYRGRGLAWATVLLPALWFITPQEQKERFRTMGDDDTSQTRLTYWRHGLQIMRDHPVLGVGFNNWLPYYRQYYNPWGQVSHNIFIEAGAEMGYLGLGSFALLIAGTFVVNARTRRLARELPAWQPFYRGLAFGLDAALVGYLISGFFVTVLFYPFFWVNLAFTSTLYLLVERRSAALRTRLRHRNVLTLGSRFPHPRVLQPTGSMDR